MDTLPMNTTLASANALHRILRQSLLATRFGPVAPTAPEVRFPADDGNETLPMLYRSEAFAEDLLDPV